ncbi:unnamed protein product [Effrenium voratum]|uniref:Uncharacterized protein n=1 Tax=Effrenium voratum TaxID=2562239 RepID=A0AA36N8J1_9DINO|nr:unnamed protein product [Effrenium voratum]
MDGSSISASFSGSRVEKGARLAKLAKASERLVSCAVADVLKQDFEALFEVALSREDMQSLPQMKTWMASTLADKAHKAQSEAMWDHQVAEFLARLDAGPEAPRPLAENDSSSALKESAAAHELQAKLGMLRRHLEQQELSNQAQEQSISDMKEDIEAAHAKLDRDTAQLAELCGGKRRTNWG